MACVVFLLLTDFQHQQSLTHTLRTRMLYIDLCIPVYEHLVVAGIIARIVQYLYECIHTKVSVIALLVRNYLLDSIILAMM